MKNKIEINRPLNLIKIIAVFMLVLLAPPVIFSDEWTETCKYNGEEYVETDELLYDKNNWTFSKERYREGIKHTIMFSTLTNFNPPLGAISSLKSEYRLHCPLDFNKWHSLYGYYETQKIKDTCFSKINAEGEKLCEEKSKDKKLMFEYGNHYKINPFGKVAVDLCEQLELNFFKEKYPKTYDDRDPPYILSCGKHYSNLIKNFLEIELKNED